MQNLVKDPPTQVPGDHIAVIRLKVWRKNNNNKKQDKTKQ